MMKYTNKIVCFSAAIGFGAGFAIASGHALAGDAQWQPLIQNESLEGWTAYGGKAPFSVAENTITGKSIAGSPSTYLTTDAIYTDFILEVEVKAQAPLNSGIQFRSKVIQPKGSKQKTIAGYQMEIDTDISRSWSGGIFDQSRRGWLTPPTDNEACRKAFQQNAWNLYRIEALGNNLRTYINDVPCSNLIDDLGPEGHIAFQIHSAGGEKVGKTVQWKNPRILLNDLSSALKTTPAAYQLDLSLNHLSEFRAQQGWQRVWDGEKFSGSQRGQWKVESGVLYSEHAGDKLQLKLPSSDFEFEADVLLEKGSEAGIFLKPGSKKAAKAFSEYKFQMLFAEPEASGFDVPRSANAFAAIAGLVPPRNLNEPEAKFDRISRGRAWNRIHVVVRGGHVQHWVNRILYVDHYYAVGPEATLEKLIIKNDKGGLRLKNMQVRALDPL